MTSTALKTVILRGLVFMEHFFVAFVNFGLFGAIRVQLIYRTRSLNRPTYVWLKPIRKRFYFRGACDRGVLSHFFTSGYQIDDSGCAEKVENIVDAGANIGDETIRFRFFHPNAKIIALEAESGNFEILKFNTQADHRTIALNVGLWSRNCQLEIVPAESKEGFQVRESVASTKPTIDAVSIDQLMQTYQMSNIDILKLDVEGAETKIFASNTSGWIHRVKVLIFEPPDREAAFTTMQIFESLRQSGFAFNCFVHGENIILIRSDVLWELKSNVLSLSNKFSKPAHSA